MKKILLFLVIVFCTDVNAQFTKLHDFDSINGSNPRSSLFSDGTFLYGTTSSGGANNFGTIFKIMPNGSNFSKLLDFDSITNGYNLYGFLISDGVFLYGMTESGGLNNLGTIFKIKPDGTGWTKLLDFDGINGKKPYGSLIFDGFFLYGMTRLGPIGNGTIFKIKTDGTGFNKIHDFSVAINGIHPYGFLYCDGISLYGMTALGGGSGYGTLFKINIDGTDFMKLIDFNNYYTGSHPHSNIIADGTYLYGTTQDGGDYNSGTIFKIMPDGTGYSKLFDFGSSISGKYPNGALFSDGTFLYGITGGGGVNNLGTAYKISLNGSVFNKLIDFDDVNKGKYPSGTFISDGTYLYSMAFSGGTNNFGTIFKYQDTIVGVEEITNDNVSIYPNPSNNSFTFKTASFIGNTMLVYNMLGKEVYKTTIINSITTIPVNELGNEGVYLLKTINKNTNEIRTSRLVVTK